VILEKKKKIQPDLLDWSQLMDLAGKDVMSSMKSRQWQES